mmetsp:Transcript_78274/g.254161  ORF Transcript_78274/g.254161 Transcript_78274/m.254161 type:complete len:260 (-) Transcript_78274:982-1761(-)
MPSLGRPAQISCPPEGSSGPRHGCPRRATAGHRVPSVGRRRCRRRRLPGGPRGRPGDRRGCPGDPRAARRSPASPRAALADRHVVHRAPEGPRAPAARPVQRPPPALPRRRRRRAGCRGRRRCARARRGGRRGHSADPRASNVDPRARFVGPRAPRLPEGRSARHEDRHRGDPREVAGGRLGPPEGRRGRSEGRPVRPEDRRDCRPNLRTRGCRPARPKATGVPGRAVECPTDARPSCSTPAAAPATATARAAAASAAT